MAPKLLILFSILCATTASNVHISECFKKHHRDFTFNVDNFDNTTIESYIDVVVLLDQSPSIGEQIFKLSLELVSDLMYYYDCVGFNRVGLILFDGKNYKEVFNLTFDFLDQYLNNTSALKYPRHPQKIFKENTSFSPIQMFNNAYNRPAIPKVLIAITDGVKDHGIPLNDRVKSEEIHTFAFGVGRHIDPEKLVKIANDDPSHVFSMNYDGDISHAFRSLNEIISSFFQKVDASNDVMRAVSHNEVHYYSFDVPINGLTLFLLAAFGSIEGNYSYARSTPFSAFAVLDSAIFIPGSLQPNSSAPEFFNNNINVGESTVVVAIKGLKDFNVYLIGIQEGNQLETVTTTLATDSRVSNSATQMTSYSFLSAIFCLLLVSLQ